MGCLVSELLPRRRGREAGRNEIRFAAAGITVLFSAAMTVMGCGGDGHAAEKPPQRVSRLAFTVQPEDTVAMQAISPPVTVELRDSSNQRVENAINTVMLSIADGPEGATLGGTVEVKAEGGIAVFDDLFLQNEGIYRLRAEIDGVGARESVSFEIFPSLLARLEIAATPREVVAGEPVDLTVSAINFKGDTEPEYRGTIEFWSNDDEASLPAPHTFSESDAGEVVLEAAFRTRGNHTVRVTDSEHPGLTASVSITVLAGEAVSLVVSPPGQTPAGETARVAVRLRDEYGNKAAGYRGTVLLESSDEAAVLPEPYTFVSNDAGEATLSVELRTAGIQNLSVRDQDLGDLEGKAEVEVIPAEAAALSLDGLPSEKTAGDASDAAVTAVDRFGNVASGYRGTISFSATDEQAALPAPYAFQASDSGERLFSNAVVLVAAGEQEVSVRDDEKDIEASMTVEVEAGPASSLRLEEMPEQVSAGTSLDVVLTALDEHSNIAVDYQGSVAFSSSDEKAALPDDYTFLEQDPGMRVFPNALVLVTAGRQTVTALDVDDAELIHTVELEVVADLPSEDETLFSVSPKSLLADGEEEAVLTVTVYDEHQNRVPGVPVTPSADGTGNVFTPEDGVTCEDGVFTSSLTTEVAGEREVTAAVGEGQDAFDLDPIAITFVSHGHTYTLTYAAGEGGSIAGEAEQTVQHGEDGSEVTAMPEDGYHFVEWSDGELSAGRTDTNVTSDLSVTAIFALNTYTLTYTAGKGGSIFGEDVQTVEHGGSGSGVTAQPDEGHHFVEWSDGRVSATRVDNDVTSDLSVTANFAPDTHTLELSSTGGGIVSVPIEGTHTYDYGDVVELVAVPDSHHDFTGWTGSAVDEGMVDDPNAANTSVTIQGSYTLVAGFAVHTYTLTYTAGEGGSIDGEATQTVEHGEDGALVTAIPNDGYQFVEWSDGELSAGRTDTDVTTDVSVEAVFALETYTLTYTAGEGGTIVGDTTQTVEHGGDGDSVTAMPSSGYNFVEWSDGETSDFRIDTNVTSDLSVTAIFALNTYTLTYTAGEGGSIDGEATQTVEHGEDGALVTAIPNDGYQFVEWSDGELSAGRTDTNVTSDLSVTANFASSLAHLGLEERAGVLYLNDEPFYGIGVNAFDLFYRTLLNPTDTSYDESLEALAEAGIPFVRFNCGGYWPVDFQLYFNNEEYYFQLLDGVVAAAEEHGIGLIPSLFWAYFTAPDLNDEPMDQLGNPASATSDYIREYTSKIVQRYKDSPAIWAWEMGNEYSLEIDLPGAENYRPPIQPVLGTPDHRTERDELKSEHMLTAYQTFAETVRLYDEDRIIRTGNAAPRPSAWHNTHHGTWDYDDEDQFKEILERDNPNPYDTVTVHTYPYSYQDLGPHYTGDIYSGPSESLYEQLYRTQKHALEIGKPLTIGEFGANSVGIGELGAEKRMEEFLFAIEHNQIQLAAVWVYDFCVHGDPGWEITFDNERSYMLDMIADVNSRISSRDAGPDMLFEPERLNIPNEYFQSLDGWLVGSTCEGGSDLTRYEWDEAVKGDAFGRAELHAPSCTYWLCSNAVTVTGEKVSLGGYFRMSGGHDPNLQVNMYADGTHLGEETATLPLGDVSEWGWHNIREKGGGGIVAIPPTVDEIRFCIVMTTSDDASAESPAILDMDNFSGFELVPG